MKKLLIASMFINILFSFITIINELKSNFVLLKLSWDNFYLAVFFIILIFSIIVLINKNVKIIFLLTSIMAIELIISSANFILNNNESLNFKTEIAAKIIIFLIIIFLIIFMLKFRFKWNHQDIPEK